MYKFSVGTVEESGWLYRTMSSVVVKTFS